MVKTQRAIDERALIERHIAPGWDRYPGGRADARLRGYGVSVWAVVAYLQMVGGDLDRVAEDYGLPHDAVQAALAYYRQHQELIDARLRLNAA